MAVEGASNFEGRNTRIISLEWRLAFRRLEIATIHRVLYKADRPAAPKPSGAKQSKQEKRLARQERKAARVAQLNKVGGIVE